MLWWCAQNCVAAALLAVVVAIVCRLWRCSPAMRHALWLVVLVKLITPPLLVFSLPLSDTWFDRLRLSDDRGAVALTTQTDSKTNTSSGIREQPDGAEQVLNPQDESGDGTNIVEWPGSGESETAPEVIEEQATEDRSPAASETTAVPSTAPVLPGEMLSPESLALTSNIVIGLWLVCSVIWCLLQAIRIGRFQRLLRGAQLPTTELVEEVAHWAHELRVAAPQILAVGGLRTPVIWSLRRPTLLWPVELSAQLPRESQAAVIIHELAHLRRRDHWVGWLELAAGAAWWWNPLYWYVRHQLRENAELACDAWVVATLPTGRRAYAAALIEVSQLVSFTAAPVPAVGMGHSARHTFERRLTMILRERVACRTSLLGMTAVVLLGLGVLPSFMLGQDEPSAPAAGIQAVADDPAAVTASITFSNSGEETNGEAKTPVETESAQAQRDGSGSITITSPLVGGTVQLVPSGQPAKPTEPRVTGVLELVSTGPDQRLQSLENRLEALLNEVRSIRREDRSEAKPAKSAQPAPLKFSEQPEHKHRYQQRIALGGPGIAPRVVYGLTVSDQQFEGAEDVTTLTRATYKITKGKAEAVSSFLKEFVADEIEARVVDDNLIVIARPETQKAIAQFLRLLQPRDKQGRATVPARVPGYDGGAPGGLPRGAASTLAPATAPNVPAVPTSPEPPAVPGLPAVTVPAPPTDRVETPASGPLETPPAGLPGASSEPGAPAATGPEQESLPRTVR